MKPAYIALADYDGTTWCGFRGCYQAADVVLVSGGRAQLRCCADCASVGIEADRANAGMGWTKKKDEVVNG